MKRIVLMLCIATGFSASPILPMWNQSNGQRNNQQRQCTLCFDEFNQRDAARLQCNHYALCPDCLHDRVTDVIRGGRLADLTCSAAGCNHRLTDQEIRNITQDSTILNQYAQLQNDRAARLARGLAPEDVEALRGNRNLKPCPECLRLVLKNGGCNHMTCSVAEGGCGHQFCWIDMQPWGGNHHNHQFGAHGKKEVRFDNLPSRLPTKNISPLVVVGAVVTFAAIWGISEIYNYFTKKKKKNVPTRGGHRAVRPNAARVR